LRRYVCIHGHFYQPPRENPWLEAIELQDSAFPYHDWNERITAECYAPNASARILGRDGRIAEIVNNYATISFNVGPTLLSWLAAHAPDVYAAILEADALSVRRYGGHGSAIAQAFNHVILPLANARDQRTQVRWGIRDFERHFGRVPEGMWLPETAVDVASLEALAEAGIRFTILASHQAARVRRIGERGWTEVSPGGIDPTMPYVATLPSGRTIAVFFYCDPIARAVAFEGLLRDGAELARRLGDAFNGGRDGAQLVHIATDGETYGHHHRYGEMALAYALSEIESGHGAEVINYAAFLERHPPTHEIEIAENTSWSCAHGVERWRADCGCRIGGPPEWTQAWRAPFRDALDWLRDELLPRYAEIGGEFLADPWMARDAYIDVLNDRSPESVAGFLDRHARRPLDAVEQATTLKLLELQRHAMLMYTSCGWFFDELSGIETVQSMRYAGRAVQLAEEIFGTQLEPELGRRLALAKSNVSEEGDGGAIYARHVKPSMVDLAKVGAHYAVSAMFTDYPERAPVYCYTAEREELRSFRAGRTRLQLGRVRVVSEITGESARFSFGVLHLGDHNLHGGICLFPGDEEHETLATEIAAPFARAEFAEVIRLLDHHFHGSTYSLRSLFRDEQRRIVDRLIESTLADAETVYRQLFEHHAPLMRFLVDLGNPLPAPFAMAFEVIVNTELRRALEDDTLPIARIEELLQEARTVPVTLDSTALEYTFRRRIESLAATLVANPTDLDALRKLAAAVALTEILPFHSDLWAVQNACYRLTRDIYPDRVRAAPDDADAAEWIETFRTIGNRLSIQLD